MGRRGVVRDEGWQGGRIRESVLGLVEEERGKGFPNCTRTEFAKVLGEGRLTDADHVNDLGDACGFRGFLAVESGALSCAEVASRVVGDGVTGVKLGIKARGLRRASASGAPRGRGR